MVDHLLKQAQNPEFDPSTQKCHERSLHKKSDMVKILIGKKLEHEIKRGRKKKLQKAQVWRCESTAHTHPTGHQQGASQCSGVDSK